MTRPSSACYWQGKALTVIVSKQSWLRWLDTRSTMTIPIYKTHGKFKSRANFETHIHVYDIPLDFFICIQVFDTLVATLGKWQPIESIGSSENMVPYKMPFIIMYQSGSLPCPKNAAHLNEQKPSKVKCAFGYCVNLFTGLAPWSCFPFTCFIT